MRIEIRQVYEDDTPVSYTYTKGLDRAHWDTTSGVVTVYDYVTGAEPWCFMAPDDWAASVWGVNLLCWADETDFGRKISV